MSDRNLHVIESEYSQRLSSELAGKSSSGEDVATRDYHEFKKTYLPKPLSYYEKLCQFSEKFFPVEPDKKKVPELKEAIAACHLNTTPVGVYSASFVFPLIIIFSSILIFFLFPLLAGGIGNMFFVMFSLLIGLLLFVFLQKLPFTLANQWRLKASNQMVLAVFYMVTYMRHTSNLELAINFAAEHLAPPLSLDLRKVVWDIETQKYDSIKDSLNMYLSTWKTTNLEFVESVNLIESSLYETDHSRRLTLLDKSLEVMLSETYNKMLRYAHGLKGPLVTLNMLGVVLPILTLVILPLVVSFMDGFEWYHLFALYNVLLPLLVYYIGTTILSTRPGGSSNEDVLKKNPRLKDHQKLTVALGKQTVSIQPGAVAFLVLIVFLVIGFFPLLYAQMGFSDIGFYQGDFSVEFGSLDGVERTNILHSFLDYREVDPNLPGFTIGPFGLGALLLSIFVPLGIGLAIGLYYKLKSNNLLKIRKEAKELEFEFSSALFQLANRIGDGAPAEIAFGKVSEVMKGTKSGKFFTLVHVNITRMGFSVEKAIFDKDRGALRYFPSDIIESAMKVLVEASRKGPLVTSQALGNVADYIQRIHSVDERLNDLLGDVVSSMRSQAMFLTPVISGVVIGITSLITNIIGSLTDRVSSFAAGQQQNVQGSGILDMFGVGIPTYFFQIVVGLYLVQLAYILAIISNGVENGPDPIGEHESIGSIVTKSVMLYAVLAFILIIVFNVVAGGFITRTT